MKIGSSTTHLTISKISLGRATIDSRLKAVIDVLKQQGDNPLPAEDDSILDLRVRMYIISLGCTRPRLKVCYPGIKPGPGSTTLRILLSQVRALWSWK